MDKNFVFTASQAQRGKLENSTKGFVFTVDSLIGAAIIAFAILSFSFTVEQPSRSEAVLERMSIDTLAVMEERGAFDSRNADAINATVNQTLPSFVRYAFIVDYFNVTPTGGLTFDRTLTVNMIPEERDAVYASRPVPIMVNESASSQVKNMTAIAKVRLGVSL
ncbi:MAG: hypothetical protein HYS81_02765 [Candidatus Aenigmatarchaeota archaeon]|nr:MAG: hypothetical protein HYS81_02765 [Candidatus Aenigmarchaeota archaeon]